MHFKQISILLSIPVIMYKLFCFLGTSKRWLKKKKKKVCFPSLYFLATMNLSSIYLSLGQIQQQKISRITVKTVALDMERKNCFPTIYSVLVVWIKIYP